MKEVIFFTYGDSTNASTWSNVPYLFTKSLKEAGITVRHVNLLPTGLIQPRIERFFRKIYRCIFGNGTYNYSRSPLYRYLRYRVIKSNVKRYNQADFCIFTCFDYYNKFSKIPSLLFCDWTYEILVERLGHQLTKREMRFCSYQSEAISNAQIVVSLFKLCSTRMKEKYENANIRHLGINVVNNLNPRTDAFGNIDEYLKNKYESKKILFVGNEKYIDSAVLLIKSFKSFLSVYPHGELHIIGLSESQLSNYMGLKVNNFSNNIFCHGYLKKDNPNDCALYYDLMMNSTVFVNINPKWGGYSSTIEAMYYYTPIIISPYAEFVDEFGEKIDFGIYEDDFSEDSLIRDLITILSSDNYKNMAKLAHQKVADYNWNEYTRRMIKCMEDYKN